MKWLAAAAVLIKGLGVAAERHNLSPLSRGAISPRR
jgi:hypothetical protein